MITSVTCECGVVTEVVAREGSALADVPCRVCGRPLAVRPADRIGSASGFEMVEPKKPATPPAGLPGPLVGMLTRVKGLVWEVTLVSDSPGAWVNLRPVDGGETRAAYYRANGAYFMDDDEVIFDDRQTTGTPRYLTKTARETALREIDSHVGSLTRSFVLLKGRLESDEEQQFFNAIERAKTATADVEDDDLRGRLADIQKAESILWEAMLRLLRRA